MAYDSEDMLFTDGLPNEDIGYRGASAAAADTMEILLPGVTPKYSVVPDAIRIEVDDAVGSAPMRTRQSASTCTLM